MNRGIARQYVFHRDDYFRVFLKTFEEVHQQFNLQIRCYFLMSTHYHSLVKTPQAVLGRVMKEIGSTTI